MPVQSNLIVKDGQVVMGTMQWRNKEKKNYSDGQHLKL